MIKNLLIAGTDLLKGERFDEGEIWKHIFGTYCAKISQRVGKTVYFTLGEMENGKMVREQGTLYPKPIQEFMRFYTPHSEVNLID